MVEINYADVIMRIDVELRKRNLKRNALEPYGVPATSISHWAKGRTPSCTSMARIADFLGVSLEWLLFGKDQEGQLDKEERELIDSWRRLNIRDKGLAMTMIKGMRQD